ncbi:MAG: hypothetical protein KC586_17930, partial [Myxococcales bacterium]|nr:hypothetical protein [Myxococcales bacterium]
GFVARVGEDLVVIPVWFPNARNEIVGAPDGPGALADELVGGAVGEATGEAPAAPRAPSPLHLVLHVGGDGVWVNSVAGRFAPGCEQTTSERSPTVPRVDGAHDLAGLTACLEQIAREHPDEDRAMVTAGPDVPFGDFAQVMAVEEWLPVRRRPDAAPESRGVLAVSGNDDCARLAGAGRGRRLSCRAATATPRGSTSPTASR